MNDIQSDQGIQTGISWVIQESSGDGAPLKLMAFVLLSQQLQTSMRRKKKLLRNESFKIIKNGTKHLHVSQAQDT